MVVFATLQWVSQWAYTNLCWSTSAGLHWSPLVSAGLSESSLVSLSLQWSPGDQQRPAETRGDHETNGDLLRHVGTSTIETPGDQWRLNETCGDLWRPVKAHGGPYCLWYTHLYYCLLYVVNIIGALLYNFIHLLINDIHIWIHGI